MTVLRKLLLAGLGLGMTVLGLLLAVYAGGPAFRKVFGIPKDFRADYTSPEAFHQALIVQAAAVGLALFVLGVVSKKLFGAARYSDAVWIANPLTVGFGFVGYRWLYHALHSPTYLADYDSLFMLMIFSLAAPVVFAGCFYLGTICVGAGRQVR